MSEEALQIAEKEEKGKSKGKRKDSHLNAEFQRIARRHKKGQKCYGPNRSRRY